MLDVVLHGFWPCVTDSTWRNQEYLRTVDFCTFFKKCYKAQRPGREPSILQPTRWESMRNKGGQMVGEVLPTLTLWLEVSPIWDDHKFQKPERVGGMNLWVGESMFLLGEAHASDRNPRVHGFSVTLPTWNHPILVVRACLRPVLAWSWFAHAEFDGSIQKPILDTRKGKKWRRLFTSFHAFIWLKVLWVLALYESPL